MSTLREWQQQFIESVISGDDHSLNIHRNNWRSNLRAALRAGYPVIERLVGAEFFGYCADGYIDTQPSRSSNLEHYGGTFPQFLRDFAPAQSLPYLADVAALEYAIEQLLVTPDDDAQIMVCSPFPILKIWQCNQPGSAAAETINLDVGGDVLRLRRAGLEVQIEKIAADAQNADGVILAETAQE
jgi:hypothetical protein